MGKRATQSSDDPLAGAAPSTWTGDGVRSQTAWRGASVIIVAAFCFAMVGARLIGLALDGTGEITISVNETMTSSFARPDIIDRNGRLLATDVEAPSLFADPFLVLDKDELVEKLATILKDINQNELRRELGDRQRRFVWIRRGLSPSVAQRIHDLGLPGLQFRRELRRAYPSGNLAGHVIGTVNVDNRGLSGIERYIDDNGRSEPVQGTTFGDLPPVRLSLDLGVQHAVEDELAHAMQRYSANGAAGIVMDVTSGEIIASASLPEVDPLRPALNLESARADKIAGSTYELGSIFKAVTIAMAFDLGLAKPGRRLDVDKPLISGRFTISDAHSVGRPLTVAEIFTHSSNVGAGMLALEAGPERQRAFLKRIGLLDDMRTEAGGVARPSPPANWQRTETITIAYGHGIAVAPLQFAMSAAALLNGGALIQPTFLQRHPDVEFEKRSVIKADTSAALARVMRLNVEGPDGTGKRASVDGYAVGGKTGTAEMAVAGGYRKKAVISSFLAAFPIDHPKYLALIMLFEPEATSETHGQITASVNAAPTSARIISRIGPLLGLPPEGSDAALALGKQASFDAAPVQSYVTRR